MSQEIKVFHSPDSDDIAMFYAMAVQKPKIVHFGQIRPRRYSFNFTAFDTEKLNQLALEGVPEVCAVSTGIYEKIKDKYQILSAGCSVARDSGPKLVVNSNISLDELLKEGATVSVPGFNTTSYKIIKSLYPNLNYLEVPITPFELVFEKLRANEVSAAVLIHEGQLTFKNHGLIELMDLVNSYQSINKLPVPLGLTVIRRDLSEDFKRQFLITLRSSILFSIKNRGLIIDYLNKLDNFNNFDVEQLNSYLDKYVNRDTFAISDDVLNSLSKLTGLSLPELNSCIFDYNAGQN